MQAKSFSLGAQEYLLEAVAVRCGDDLTVVIGGGEKQHIGAVAVGVPRPSLKDKNIVKNKFVIVTVKAKDIKKINFPLKDMKIKEMKKDSITFVYQDDINKIISLIKDISVDELLIEEPTIEEIFMHYYKED